MNADRGTDPSFVEVLISDPDLRLNPTAEWSPHARDRWGERAGAVGYLRAWAQSEEVDYPLGPLGDARPVPRSHRHSPDSQATAAQRRRGRLGVRRSRRQRHRARRSPRRRAAPRPPAGTRGMSRQVTIKQPRDKRESRLTEVENRNQKASVYHHRQVAVLVASMSTHTTQRKRYFGSTEPQPPVYGNIVNAGTLLTAPTEGVRL